MKRSRNELHSGGDELPNHRHQVVPLLWQLKGGGRESKVLPKCRTKWKTGPSFFYFFFLQKLRGLKLFSRSMGLYAHNGRV